MAIDERSSMWERETGESHDNSIFVGLGIPLTIKILTMATPPSSCADSSGSRGTRLEVGCGGVERVIVGMRERSKSVNGSREVWKCGWRSNSVANSQAGGEGFVVVVDGRL